MRPTRIRYRAVSWLTLAAILAYLVRNVAGVAESTIRAEFKLSELQTGWFMGMFFWSYALLQIPAGLFGQRFGTRIALGFYALLWALGAIVLGFSVAFWMLLAAQFMIGFAQAGAFPAATQAISKWMPLSQRSIACGFLAAGMQVGAIVAATLTGLFLAGGWGWDEFVVPLVGWTCPEFVADKIPWRWIYVIFAVPSLLFAAGFFLRFRDVPQAHSGVNVAELERIREEQQPVGESSEPTPWRAGIESATLWLLCGQQFFRAAGYAFFATWFPSFVQKSYGVDVKGSGFFQALIFAATLAGCLGGGWLVDFVWRRTRSLRASRSGVGVVCLGLTGMLILSAYFVPNLGSAIALLVAAAFLAALGGPCAYSTAIDISGRHVAPFFGMMNMWGNIGAGVTPILLGLLFSQIDNWNVVLIIFGAIYLFGAVCWALIDPARKIEAKQTPGL